MKDSIEVIEALRSLQRHRGFPHLLEIWSDKSSEVLAKLVNPATDAGKYTELRGVYNSMINHSPMTLIESEIVRLEAQGGQDND